MVLPIAPTKLLWSNGRDEPIVQTRRRMVFPSGGASHLRCGKCGATDFTVHVVPGNQGTARINGVACSICGNVFEANMVGELGGTLKNAKRNVNQREKINADQEHD